MTSSPGYPYLLRAPTNGNFLGYSDGKCDPEKVDYVWYLVQRRLTGEDEPDEIRLFVKPEPHKIKKLEQGRYRLISSVSLIDQIVDHMLFGDCNEALLSNWETIPSKPGWSHMGGGWRMIPVSQWIASDKSAWDWTVQAWLVELCLELRVRLCGNMTDSWYRCAERRYKQLYGHPVFITSNGLKLQQKTPGIMKSGCVNTIADNSMMQYMLHARVSLELGIPLEPLYSMGDDVLQAPMEREKEYFDLIGQFCKLKEVAHRNEFAGFRFIGGRIEPCHKGKHSFNLLHMNPEFVENIGTSYQLLYHRSVYRQWITDLFQQLGAGKEQPEWLSTVVDGL